MTHQHPADTPPDALTDGITNLIGDLLAPADPNSEEQINRAHIRGLARSVVGAMRADETTTAGDQAQAIVRFPQYGAAPGIAAEHLAEFVRRVANWPINYPDTPEMRAAATTASAVLSGGPGAAEAAERMRQNDDLARNTVLLLGHHVRTLLDFTTEWGEAAEMDFYDAIEGKRTFLDRRDI